MKNIHVYPTVSLGLGFLDIILKLATTSPCSKNSSGTKREQNKSRHGKWCNSIHLQVNPSGEPEPGSLPDSAPRSPGPTPRRGLQEARVARRDRPFPSSPASAAWRPPARRRGPADPSVASASLLPRALLRTLLLPTSEELLLPATPSAYHPARGGCCSLRSRLFAFLFPSLFFSLAPSLFFFRAFLQTSRGQIIAAQRNCRRSCSVKFFLSFLI